MSWRTDPLGCILLGFIAIIYSGRCYTIYDKYIVCRIFGIPYRKLYWGEFDSGFLISPRKKISGRTGQTVIVLTILGSAKYNPEMQTVSKYVQSHPIGVIQIALPSEELTKKCISAFSKHCPNFQILLVADDDSKTL